MKIRHGMSSMLTDRIDPYASLTLGKTPGVFENFNEKTREQLKAEEELVKLTVKFQARATELVEFLLEEALEHYEKARRRSEIEVLELSFECCKETGL